jgi:hypothetical protein
MFEVGIRIWKDCTVCGVFVVSDTGMISLGAVGGAGNSTKVDIELDPWAGLVVDNRVKYSSPVSIRGETDDHDSGVH